MLTEEDIGKRVAVRAAEVWGAPETLISTMIALSVSTSLKGIDPMSVAQGLALRALTDAMACAEVYTIDPARISAADKRALRGIAELLRDAADHFERAAK